MPVKRPTKPPLCTRKYLNFLTWHKAHSIRSTRLPFHTVLLLIGPRFALSPPPLPPGPGSGLQAWSPLNKCPLCLLLLTLAHLLYSVTINNSPLHAPQSFALFCAAYIVLLYYVILHYFVYNTGFVI